MGLKGNAVQFWTSETQGHCLGLSKCRSMGSLFEFWYCGTEVLGAFSSTMSLKSLKCKYADVLWRVGLWSSLLSWESMDLKGKSPRYFYGVEGQCPGLFNHGFHGDCGALLGPFLS